MNTDYYFYFVNTENGIRIKAFPTEKRGAFLTAFTNEQKQFYIEHPDASISEIKNCRLNSPIVVEQEETPIETIKENAIKDIDSYSRDTLAKFVDNLEFANALASSVYAKQKNIEPIYDDSLVTKTASDFLIKGSLCRNLYKDTVSLIEDAETKEEIDNIVNSAKSQYNVIAENIDSIEKYRLEKLQEIDLYDTSINVNGFYLNGSLAWLDKETRVGLVNTLKSARMLNRDTVNIWFNGFSLTLPVDSAEYMLAQVELYATDCYNVTASHKAEVSLLDNVEDIDAYDVTLGYPDKLSFNL